MATPADRRRAAGVDRSLRLTFACHASWWRSAQHAAGRGSNEHRCPLPWRVAQFSCSMARDGTTVDSTGQLTDNLQLKVEPKTTAGDRLRVVGTNSAAANQACWICPEGGGSAEDGDPTCSVAVATVFCTVCGGGTVMSGASSGTLNCPRLDQTVISAVLPATGRRVFKPIHRWAPRASLMSRKVISYRHASGDGDEYWRAVEAQLRISASGRPRRAAVAIVRVTCAAPKWRAARCLPADPPQVPACESLTAPVDHYFLTAVTLAKTDAAYMRTIPCAGPRCRRDGRSDLGAGDFFEKRKARRPRPITGLGDPAEGAGRDCAAKANSWRADGISALFGGVYEFRASSPAPDGAIARFHGDFGIRRDARRLALRFSAIAFGEVRFVRRSARAGDHLLVCARIRSLPDSSAANAFTVIAHSRSWLPARLVDRSIAGRQSGRSTTIVAERYPDG